MGYHSFLRNYPEAKNPSCPYYFRIFPVPLLQLLGAEKGQGAGAQSMTLWLLLFQLSPPMRLDEDNAHKCQRKEIKQKRLK